MTDEFVECFNCGRANPEWAHVCRSCGVSLRDGSEWVTPASRIPTDQRSLLSIGGVLGAIVLAVIVGLMLSRLYPVDPSIGQDVSTPTPSPTVEPTESATPAPTDTPVPTDTPPPGPPGTIVFGTAVDANDQTINPVETFTPGQTFAHTVTVPQPWGGRVIREQIVRINADGSETEVESADLEVVPDLNYATYDVPVDNLFAAWGPGTYELRVIVSDEVVAAGRFTLAEG